MTKFVLNKSTKIWLNYSLGAIISIFLLWSIYRQVNDQLKHIDLKAPLQTGPSAFLYACLLLLPLNILLEGKKWHILANLAQPLTYGRALQSYLAGIAFAIVTPNRIGEYPGRILYLKRANTFRLISVSILGSVAQMLTVFIYGLLGLVYYNFAFPGVAGKALLAFCLPVTLGLGFVYWWFDRWMPIVKKIKFLRRFNIYGQLLSRFDNKVQLMVLGISLLRYAVFTAQYLFLLRWMNVEIPLAEGFCMAGLFFWTIAIIPTIALTELGERGQVSLYLFHHFSANSVGILGATMGIWFLNLIIPSLIGSILLVRMRLLS